MLDLVETLNIVPRKFFKKLESTDEIRENYDERFETFKLDCKLGDLLKQAGNEAQMTQEQIARELQTSKSVISRMENHATDIRLSTLEKFAKALGRRIRISLV